MSEPTEQPNDIQLKAEGDIDIKKLVEVIQKLSTDVHTMKGNLAANTSFTRELLEKQQVLHDGQQALNERQAVSDSNLSSIATATAEMIALFESGKKGVSFFQGFGRFLNKLARWATPIIVLGGLIWGLMHGDPPKGH